MQHISAFRTALSRTHRGRPVSTGLPGGDVRVPGRRPWAVLGALVLTATAVLLGAESSEAASAGDTALAAVPPTSAAVNMANDSFVPGNVTVSTGGTVTWTNTESTPHTATSDNGSFDSSMLTQNQTFSHVFNQAGTFGYVCQFHDRMVGTVTVVPDGVTAPAKPRIGTASSGAAGGTVTAAARWAPPLSDGGMPVTGYVVTALRMGANGSVLGKTRSPLLPPSARSRSLTLLAGKYRFVVVARNAVGTSGLSARSNLVTAR